MKIFTFVRLIEIDRNDEYFTLKNKLNFVSPFFKIKSLEFENKRDNIEYLTFSFFFFLIKNTA